MSSTDNLRLADYRSYVAKSFALLFDNACPACRATVDDHKAADLDACVRAVRFKHVRDLRALSSAPAEATRAA